MTFLNLDRISPVNVVPPEAHANHPVKTFKRLWKCLTNPDEKNQEASKDVPASVIGWLVYQLITTSSVVCCPQTNNPTNQLSAGKTHSDLVKLVHHHCRGKK